MPQKRTESPGAITSGTVLPAAARTSCRVGRHGLRAFVRRLPAGLSFPDVWVAGDEARRVHAELGHELAARALVRIGRRVEVAVALRERLEGEAREAEPGRMHLCLPANGQIEPANRKQVGGRAEVEVEVDRARHRGTLHAVEPPAAGGIDREIDLDRRVSDPTRHASGYGSPSRVADHHVVEPARLPLVGEDRRSDEMPGGILRSEERRVGKEWRSRWWGED